MRSKGAAVGGRSGRVALASCLRVLRWLALWPTVLLISACNHDVRLLDGLDQQRANAVVAVLLHNGVEVHKTAIDKGGYAIDVPPGDFAAAVDLLRRYELPGRPSVEISEAFPGDALITSPAAERTRVLSYVEQRLEQTLATLVGVISVRVHLSYPMPGAAESRQNAPMRASVLLHYRDDERGANDQAWLIDTVKRFVKNSVADLESDNISVVLDPSGPPPRKAERTSTAPSASGFPLRLRIGAAAFIALAALMAGIALVVTRSAQRRGARAEPSVAADVERQRPAWQRLPATMRTAFERLVRRDAPPGSPPIDALRGGRATAAVGGDKDA